MGDKLLPDAAVQAIQESVKTEIVTVDDVRYSTRLIHDLRKPEPSASPLEVNTLQGIVDYLALNESDHPIIHIVGHDAVNVIGVATGHFKQRDKFLSATCKPVLGSTLTFGQYADSEMFIVALQSLFVMTDELEGVLRVVGNIKEESVRTTGDDGRTQSVIAKSGIAKVEDVEVPNKPTLQPYRTFREIDQPKSPFILRLRSGVNGQKPTCALFEADGGGWKLVAIQRIKEWLTAQVPSATIIA